ncbi:MAG: ATP-dependent zinc protease [Pirellulaceae bacterium]|nr:ATP-dependent zinc protease [Pirellulaceae bacterium]
MNSGNAEKTPVIGWREWIKLPDLGISSIKAKIDTGARSSSLHAVDVEIFRRDGKTWVRFKVHPLQRTSSKTIEAEAEVLEFRRVRSSSGHTTMRPVIVTTLDVLGRSWPIEVTLADRADMGFRMLLGREAVRGRLLVDPGKSYNSGRPPKLRRPRGG